MNYFTKSVCVSALLALSTVSSAGVLTLSDVVGVPGYEDYKDHTGWYGAGFENTTDVTFELYALSEETSNKNFNSFGLYNYTVNHADHTISFDSGNVFEIFSGSDDGSATGLFGSGGASVTVSVDKDTGKVYKNTDITNQYALNDNFGFYLDTGVETFYSHNGVFNDKEDNLSMFDLSDNPIGLNGVNLLLAWEDTVGEDDGLGLSVRDFDDMVIGITDVHGVPIPATFALMGLGLLAMRVKSKRKFV